LTTSPQRPPRQKKPFYTFNISWWISFSLFSISCPNKNFTGYGRRRHSLTCPLCNYQQENVDHHLFDCTVLDDIRTTLLPPKLDRTNTLYGSTEQMKNTCRYHYMACLLGCSSEAAGSITTTTTTWKKKK
jgi:hypothetical protein